MSEAVGLSGAVDPRSDWTAIEAGGQRVATRRTDSLLYATVLLTITGAAVVAGLNERLLFLADKPLLFGAFPVALGAILIGMMRALHVRRCRAAHERFAARDRDLRIEVGPEGFRARTRLREAALSWLAVDEVFDLPRGLAVRAGLFILPIPDALLPPGLDREALKARVAAWREDAEA